jgi:hypothetical protein
MPRWSVARHLPATAMLTAGESAASACVRVSPPLAASAASFGSASCLSLASRKPQVVSPSRLPPSVPTAKSQSSVRTAAAARASSMTSDVLPATIELTTVTGTNDRAPRLSNRGPAMPPPRAPFSARLPVIVTCVSVVEPEPLTAIAPPPLPKLGPLTKLPEKVEFSTASVPRQTLMAPPRAIPSPSLTAPLPANVLRATETWALTCPGSTSIAPPNCATLPSKVESLTTRDASSTRAAASAGGDG